jgi:hypothetical protein
MNLSLIDTSGTIINKLEIKPMRIHFLNSKLIKQVETKKLNNSFLTSIKTREGSKSIIKEKPKPVNAIVLRTDINKSVDKKDFTFRPEDNGERDKIYKYDKKFFKNKLHPMKIIINNNTNKTFLKVIKTREDDKTNKSLSIDKIIDSSANSTVYDSLRKSRDSPKIMKKHPGFGNFFD